MKILLSAPPGVGKSTIIDAVVRQLPGVSRGIVAREVLDAAGKRSGFTSFNAACDSRQFMFLAAPGKGTVGDFTVDVQAVDDFVVPELRHALQEPGLVYVDEIGRAQAQSPAFLQVLRDLMSSNKDVLASIVYDPEPWSLEYKNNNAACVVEVTVANRNALPEILLAGFANAQLWSRLTAPQQTTVYNLLQKLLRDQHFVSARKLFDNALSYVVENKIDRQQESPDSVTYKVAGKTRNHVLIRTADGGFRCDCDLSNGRGDFAHAEPCSHQLSALIQQAGVDEPARR